MSIISTELIYWISALLPLVLMPVVIPMVTLMANRKRMMDAPNGRKLQKRPIPVMGGTVMVLALCITLVIMNLFYSVNDMMPAICVMVIFYIFGMLDDMIGLSWQMKMTLQVLSILLVYFGGDYGVNSLYGLFGIEETPWWLALLLTLFTGLLLLNAVNFVDGIDGLASALGIVGGAIMGYWNAHHSYVSEAILSFAMTGVLASFFAYNVFSKRYKMYMGDSGSLVLGFFIFTACCPNDYISGQKIYVSDSYFVSFTLSLLSAMIFDLARVVVGRMFKGHSPFLPDRTHLHHAMVDAGMSHFVTVLSIVILNMIVMAIWYWTSAAGINIDMQYFVIIISGVVFIWGPYFYLKYIERSFPHHYYKLMKRNQIVSSWFDKIGNVVRIVLDGRRSRSITHRIE